MIAEKSDSKSEEDSRSRIRDRPRPGREESPKDQKKGQGRPRSGPRQYRQDRRARKHDEQGKANRSSLIWKGSPVGRVSLPIEEGLIDGVEAGCPRADRITSVALSARPARGEEGAGKPSLRRFDLKTREEETLADGIDVFHISADQQEDPLSSRRLKIALPGIVDAGKFNKGDGALAAIGAVSIRIEPRAEWAQMFREAWRINRDYFYATNMHGADWNAVRSKYEAHTAAPGKSRRP